MAKKDIVKKSKKRRAPNCKICNDTGFAKGEACPKCNPEGFLL